jgi:hypothetical protein
MANEIKIIIGGDASQFTAAVKESNEAMGTFTGLTNQTSSSLRKVATESANTADNLKKVAKAAENIIPEGSILEARESVKRLKGEIAGLTNVQLKSDSGKFLTSELKLAEQELKNLEVEAGLARKKIEKIIPQKLPLGAIEEAKARIKALQTQIQSLNASQIKAGEGKALSANLAGAEKELKSLEIQAGLANQSIGGAGLTKGFGLLRTAAQLIPGIGISGIIAAIGATAIEVGADLFKMADAAKLAGQDIAKSFADAEGKAAGERATLQSLLGIARNETLSKEARTEAINKLNQEYDKYLPKLSLENINTAAVTDEVNKLSAALLRQAKIKGLQDLISRETAKQADLLTNSLEDNANSWDKIVAVIKGVGAGPAGVIMQNQIAGAERTGIAYKEASDKLKIFNQSLNELLTTEAEQGTLFTEKEKRGKKEEDLLKKRLEALEKIKAATKDAASLVGLQEAIFELQVKIAVRDQGKNNLSKGELDQAIQGFQKQLNEAFKNQAIELEAIPKVKFSQVVLADISQKDISSVIAKATGFDKKIVLPTQFEVDVRFNGKDFADKMERTRQQIKGVTDAIFNGIVSGIEQGSVLLGEALGNILSGNGVANALAKAAQGLLSIIGDVLISVGKQVIITSSLVAALKKALQGLFGPGGEIIGLAVGAALIATGALLKNIQFDVPKLAQGGIATGPTLGIFGEAGKEAIIPLDRLPDIIGKLSMNNQSNVTLAPTLRFSLTDMELGLERVRSTRRRLG